MLRLAYKLLTDFIELFQITFLTPYLPNPWPVSVKSVDSFVTVKEVTRDNLTF